MLSGAHFAVREIFDRIAKERRDTRISHHHDRPERSTFNHEQASDRENISNIESHDASLSLLLETNETTPPIVSKKRKKLSSSSLVLAHYDEYKRLNRHMIQKVLLENLKFKNQVIYKPLLESLDQLMNYLNYHLNDEHIKYKNITNVIEEMKKQCIEDYQSIVSNRYGNVYAISSMIENIESLECQSDLQVYQKMKLSCASMSCSSHDDVPSLEEFRMDSILQVLEYHQCIFNEPIILYNDSQLYKYLNLSIHYGNLYENVKYIQQPSALNESFTSQSVTRSVTNIQHKIIHFILCRHCKTIYNKFQKYKSLKIQILYSYISNLQNKYSKHLHMKRSFNVSMKSYIQYLMDCTTHFIKYGHLKTLSQKFQKVIPKFIQHVLTRNTLNFKQCHDKISCPIHYELLIRNISSQSYHPEYSSVGVERNLQIFLTTLVSPMQIHKYIETNSMFYITNDMNTFFETYAWTELESRGEIQISKLYEYLTYKYGYYNNDWILDKYHEMIHDQLNPYIQNRIHNTILSTQMNLFKREFPYLPLLFRGAFPTFTINEISVNDPNCKELLEILRQYILQRTILAGVE
ncbi:hypothetical protein C9374_007714 [Naegleria lovaniensis]|uniref:Uncharacterized protein n=1 Tax=Naegleria lovaniensis TaxID=51637 RepID=A0AA88KIB8_NAELO|nr:uncharacterized protein C9374_007714 [Naegleria lovaniensis]KAG2379076.1 hypothetical protein C9374_007714 [Naegleria lovaniensis]